MGIFLARCGLPAGDAATGGVVTRWEVGPSVTIGWVSALRDADLSGDSGRVVGVSLFVPAAVPTSPSLDSVTYFLTCEEFLEYWTPSGDSTTRLLPDLRTTTHGVGLKVVENLFTLSCLTSTSSPTSTLVYLTPLLSSACILDSPFSSASLSRTSKSSRYSSVKSGSFPLNFRL